MTSKLSGARWVALASVVALSAVLLPGLANADELAAPPSTRITLDVVTVNGSGCPAGTASVSVLPDNSGFRINYSDFRAEAGGGAAPTAFRENCQVNLNVHIPQGFTFAIARADYWGRARLAAGATALQRSNYYYQGSSENNVVDHTYSGPLNGTWHSTDVTEVAELVYAPCGAVRNLNINTELRVDAGTSTSRNWISMRASDGQVYTIVQFQWKTC
jgi:hypothetical protein